MTRNLIVGSGPAAVGAALALVDAAETEEVMIIDAGVRLEPHLDPARRMFDAGVADAADGRDDVDAQPVVRGRRSLPEKRSYGSDFPFRDIGQRHGLSASGTANAAVISAAFGGFSNVWGAQVMPHSRESFSGWPVSYDDLVPHYRAVLEAIPYAAVTDDLAERFPLLAPAKPLPPLGERSFEVLNNYARHRDAIRARGVTLGRARLAFRADECVRCGLCMTGCPDRLVYSASHTIDDLVARRRVKYEAGLLAVEVGEDTQGPFVRTRGLSNGRGDVVRADRVFLACGGIGTSKLVLQSLHGRLRRVELQESTQFAIPFVSKHATSDPTALDDFTLNQFNMVIDVGPESGRDVAQLHFYTYNPAFEGALPALFGARGAARARSAALRRLTVALGYLPSWYCPPLVMSVDGCSIELSGSPFDVRRSDPARSMYRRLVEVGPRLDLWPMLPFAVPSAPGKSYHWGGAFPHAHERGTTSTDATGRLALWDHIHLIDGAVLPDVPATTFTLTVMANAHRIATEVKEQPR